MKKYTITVNGTAYEVFVEEEGAVESAPVAAPKAAAPAAAPAPKAAPAPAAPAGGNTVNAPMPGTILKMNVKVGDTVAQGGLVCILEAMKMENEIFSEKGGKVVAINAPAGTAVQSGDVIVTLG